MALSMMFAGLKLGGNERGGKSLKVATNWKTSSITPYIFWTWLSCQSQKVLDVMSARSNGSCIRLKIFCSRSVVNGSAHTPIVPSLHCSEKTYFQSPLR